MSDDVVKVPRPKRSDDVERPPLFQEVPVRELASAKLNKGGSVSILGAESIGLKITSLIPAGGEAPLVYFQVDGTVYTGPDGQEDAVEALVGLGRVRKG